MIIRKRNTILLVTAFGVIFFKKQYINHVTNSQKIPTMLYQSISAQKLIDTFLTRNIISLVKVFNGIYYFEQPIYYVINSEGNSFRVSS